MGFDVKTIRKVIRLRKIDVEKRREEEELLGTLQIRYRIGIKGFLPL